MSKRYRKKVLLVKWLRRQHSAASVGGRRARLTLCVGLDLHLLQLHLHLHRVLLVLVLVLRGTRVRDRVVEAQAQRVVRGRVMMDMGRRRSSFTSLAVRLTFSLPFVAKNN